MTAIVRRTMRGAAAGMGALAIIAGTAACGVIGGGDSEGGGEGTETGVEEPAEQDSGDTDSGDTGSEDADAESTGSEDTDSEGTDEGDDAGVDDGQEADEGEDAASGEPLTEEDLTAASDRFYAFFQAIGNEDPETACSLVIDYRTGEPTTGSGMEECVTSFEEDTDEDFDPSMLDFLQRDMIEAADNGDGQAAVLVMGESADTFMQQADDGKWYIAADSEF